MATESNPEPTVSPGDRVEVFWSIINDEGTERENESCLWWPGSIAGPATDETGRIKCDDDGSILYVIDYDAYAGFDAEQAEVAFVGMHLLRSVEDGAHMAWRRHGDDWEDVHVVLEPYKDDALVSAEEFLEQQMQEIRDATGLQSEAEAVQHLESEIPRDRLLDGAHALNEFAAQFMQHVRQAMENQTPNADGHHVITKDCVDAFVHSFKAKQQS